MSSKRIDYSKMQFGYWKFGVLLNGLSGSSCIVDDIVGEHWIIELYECPSSVLDDVEWLRLSLQAACKEAQLNLLELMEHSFTPQGVTMLGLLSESHISLHTWPEKGYAALDLFTCGEKKHLGRALALLTTNLQAKRQSCQIVKRGLGKVNCI